jgi:carotenoid cleavage dioxygenase-like enzyme
MADLTNLKSYLDGVFAPVEDELTESKLTVIGQIPPGMDGMFVQNNPNPFFEPPGAYHWFDGDGMLHGLQIRDGVATYRNRYIKTEGLAHEQAHGGPVWHGLLNPIDFSLPGGPDKNTANTDVIWHGDKLLALWWLGGEPYGINVPDLSTQGPQTFGGGLPCGIAAHSKVDERTGELIFFDYSPYSAPYLQYGVVSHQGEVKHHTVIDVPGPRFFHDIAFTGDYTVFLDLPMSWDIDAVAHGHRKVSFDPEMAGRIGILRRYADGESIRWFEVSSCYVYHMINAWEQTNAKGQAEIVVTGCRIENPLPSKAHNQEPDVPRLYFLRMDPYLYRWTLNLETGAVKEEKLDDVRTEFPRMNDHWIGRKSRYGYSQRLAPEATLLFDGVIKYDLDTGAGIHHTYGDSCVAGETVFVPRPGAREEDDGWLTTFVTDRRQARSELHIIDAQTMITEARVLMPRRVPIGFHAHWVPGKGIPREEGV